MLAATAAGGDRQELHERIRGHSHAAASRIKLEGAENDLIERLSSDAVFAGVDFKNLMRPKRYVGRAPEQVDEFVRAFVTPIRRRYRNALGQASDLAV